MDPIKAKQFELLQPILEWFGYGSAMQLISEEWEKKLTIPGGSLVVGPARAMTVPCGCPQPHKCDWCCGCGWLTRHVKAIKDQTQRAVSTRPSGSILEA